MRVWKQLQTRFGVWPHGSADAGAKREPPAPVGTRYVVHGTADDWGYVLTEDGGRVLYREEG